MYLITYNVDNNIKVSIVKTVVITVGHFFETEVKPTDTASNGTSPRLKEVFYIQEQWGRTRLKSLGLHVATTLS